MYTSITTVIDITNIIIKTYSRLAVLNTHIDRKHYDCANITLTVDWLLDLLLCLVEEDWATFELLMRRIEEDNQLVDKEQVYTFKATEAWCMLGVYIKQHNRLIDCILGEFRPGLGVEEDLIHTAITGTWFSY
jgi:hypothetical protein